MLDSPGGRLLAVERGRVQVIVAVGPSVERDRVGDAMIQDVAGDPFAGPTSGPVGGVGSDRVDSASDRRDGAIDRAGRSPAAPRRRHSRRSPRTGAGSGRNGAPPRTGEYSIPQKTPYSLNSPTRRTISALRCSLRREARPLAIWVTNSSKNWPRTLATIPLKPSSSRLLTSSIPIRNRGAASPPGSMLTRARTSKPNFRHPSGVCRLRATRSVIGPLTGPGTRPRSGRRPAVAACAARSRAAGSAWTIPRIWPSASRTRPAEASR